MDASPGTPCCDVCSVIVRTSYTRSRVVDKLDISFGQPLLHQSLGDVRAVRSVTLEKRLRDRLQLERDAIVDSESGYKMLGKM